MPRHANFDSPGTLHHVMVRGIEQRRPRGFCATTWSLGCRNRDTGKERRDAVSLKDKPSLEWEFGLALRRLGRGVIKIEIRRVLIGGLEVVCGKDPSGR
jgi:hypothetical protein